ncbi:hypothetical protein [Lachnoclostridium phytofermentans]|uniref:Uncharacterized protein n=1 Tax=Lachnoclostridium phytofermentans (strain ATCC 700394 / DSM 18823 / ISDg) TaxID=357809 RepID=A9KHP7_LACP7|nr:hypothetical protein [Lachnoclostridium phytofermentans]ABX42332.1 hypothetical protein Cphy_1964 [Lachnoclostridium phytofermentans ISDg]
MEYKKQYFKSLLIQGKLREAVKYLLSFEENKALVERYYETFDQKKDLTRSDNQVIQKIDAIYQEYYRIVFWEEKSEELALRYLCENFSVLLGESVPSFKTRDDMIQTLDQIECKLKKLVEREGFQYLGDTTAAWYGPYIWKETVPTKYSIELPDQTYDLVVNMMEGFISRSWLDYLSFGDVGTGGWAKEEGQLFCVKQCYMNKIDTPSFQISYLKHEAQHAVDKMNYDSLDSVVLEYRAKLVELIYYPNISKFHEFLLEADKSNTKNSHSYASFLIISKLSKRILHKEFVESEAAWLPYENEIRKVARDLYKEHPDKAYELE